MANFLLEALGEDSFGHVALYTSLFSGGEKILMPFGYAQDQVMRAEVRESTANYSKFQYRFIFLMKNTSHVRLGKYSKK